MSKRRKRDVKPDEVGSRREQCQCETCYVGIASNINSCVACSRSVAWKSYLSCVLLRYEYDIIKHCHRKNVSFVWKLFSFITSDRRTFMFIFDHRLFTKYRLFLLLASAYNLQLYGYIPKCPFRGKFYSKYIVYVTYTILYRVKFSSKRTFWNVTCVTISWSIISMQLRESDTRQIRDQIYAITRE